MLIISSRQNFWSNNRVSKRKDDEIRDVNLETLDESSVDPKQFIEQIKNRKILLLIHGYNNKPFKVVNAYKTIEKAARDKLKEYHNLTIGYTWPGGDDFTDYYAAKKRIETSVANSANSLITKLISNCSEIDIMAHSSGCRIALMAMNDLKTNRVPKRLYLMAAAIDNDLIENGERFYEGSNYCDNAYIFHSKYDPALKLKNIPDAINLLLKGGWIYSWMEKNDALGYSGPEDPANISPKVKVINCKKKIKKHGAYKNNDSIYTFIQKELKDNNKASQFSTL